MKRNIIRVGFAVLALVAVTVLSSCGRTQSALTTGKVDDLSYYIVKDDSLSRKPGSIGGKGAVAFVSNLTDQERNFALNFSLEEKGSVTWVFYGDTKLENGAAIKFSRDGKKLKAEIRVRSKAPIDISSKFAGIDASVPVVLFVDVHNGESPTHVMVWKTPAANDTKPFSDESALFDSEEKGFNLGDTNGAGSKWGVIVDQGTATGAKVGVKKSNK